MAGFEAGYAIRQLDAEGIRAAAPDLAELLIDCVEGGASIGFMHGLNEARARDFWRGIAQATERDGRAFFIAIREADEKIVGTVQMIPAPQENQPHRGDIAKMQVLRAARRHGLGARLMRAAEDAARRMGKTVLTLDTASDDAERLYAALGWTRVGVVPDYALLPDGRPCATIFFFRQLTTYAPNRP